MLKKLAIVGLMLICTASIASASIVDANSRQGGLDIGVGTGILWSGANLQYGIADNLSIGADYGTVDLTLAGGWIILIFDPKASMTGEYYDVHLNYQIVEGTDEQPVSVSILGGIGGTVVKLNNVPEDNKTIAVGGICLSSPMFSDNLIARLNLVVGPPLGAEVAWKITDNFEINAGLSLISIMGLKISF